MKGHKAVPGITLDWDKVDVSGFPFRLDVDVSTISASMAPGAHGPFGWSSRKIRAACPNLWPPPRHLRSGRPADAAWTDAAGAAHSVTFLPGSLHASTIAGCKGLSRVDLDMVGMSGEGHRRLPISSSTCGAISPRWRRRLDLMVKADDGGRPHSRCQVYVALEPCGRRWRRCSQGETSWPEACANWRAEGGHGPAFPRWSRRRA